MSAGLICLWLVSCSLICMYMCLHEVMCWTSFQQETFRILCIGRAEQNVLIALFKEVTCPYKVDLPVCCHSSCCCWQENGLWFGSFSVKMVWHWLDNTIEGNHRYLTWEGGSSEGICFTKVTSKPKPSVLSEGLRKNKTVKPQWSAIIVLANEQWADYLTIISWFTSDYFHIDSEYPQKSWLLSAIVQ